MTLMYFTLSLLSTPLPYISLDPESLLMGHPHIRGKYRVWERFHHEPDPVTWLWLSTYEALTGLEVVIYYSKALRRISSAISPRNRHRVRLAVSSLGTARKPGQGLVIWPPGPELAEAGLCQEPPFPQPGLLGAAHLSPHWQFPSTSNWPWGTNSLEAN
jgi:hypothetical protein